MSTTSRLAGALLFTSSLIAPAIAFAQQAPAANDQPPTGEIAGQPAADRRPMRKSPRASRSRFRSRAAGGGTIVVTGRRNRDPSRSSSQVLSVLSTEQIARTGEGDIAGALTRVTGLSVVGNGYVYVRGLGDRYSLALLNGSPLPSPEPLRRVVPLDIFPTGVIASSLVQKSYSVNYPGEFGGGVINLTTKAVPRESFLTIGGGGSYDSETTGQLGYSYYGAKSDWTGFDNGSRVVPPALQAFIDSGQTLSAITPTDNHAIGSELIRFSRATVQRVKDQPLAYSVAASGGTSFELGDVSLGVIAAAGLQQQVDQPRRYAAAFLGQLGAGARHQLSTASAPMTGSSPTGCSASGLEWGSQPDPLDQPLHPRHDQARADQLRQGLHQRPDSGPHPAGHRLVRAAADRHPDGGGTAADRQPVGRPARRLCQLAARGALRDAFRIHPHQCAAADPYGNLFVNSLNRSNLGAADVAFSDLNEDLFSGGIDITYKVTPEIAFTAGGVYVDTDRVSSRRDFAFYADSTYPTEAFVLRPDLLLSPGLVNGSTDSQGVFQGGVTLRDNDPGSPKSEAKLCATGPAMPSSTGRRAILISLDAGVRYEHAKQQVTPIAVYTNARRCRPPPSSSAITGCLRPR